MPIFEYKCGDCGKRFEFLQRGKDVPECPACASKNLKKLLSRFNASVQGGADGGASCPTCPTCSGGTCSISGK